MSVETLPPSSSHAIVRIPVRLRRLTLNYCLHRHIPVAASASILHHAFSIYTIIARYQGPVRIFVVVIVGTTPSCSSHFALFQQFHSTALCMTWKILLPDSCITIPRSRPSGIWQQCVLQLTAVPIYRKHLSVGKYSVLRSDLGAIHRRSPTAAADTDSNQSGYQYCPLYIHEIQ